MRIRPVLFCILFLQSTASALCIPSLYLFRLNSAQTTKPTSQKGTAYYTNRKSKGQGLDRQERRLFRLLTLHPNLRRWIAHIRGLLFPKPRNTQNRVGKEEKAKGSTTTSDKQKASKQTKQWRVMISPFWTRILYIVTAINPAIAVLFNDYNKMLEPNNNNNKENQKQNRLAAAYGTIFFFARLNPRVSFAIGAILRALQLTTAFQYVFDPTAGVGFGLNSICWFARSRWPATIVLGWSITKPMWKVLGACPPSGLPVPITVRFRTETATPSSTSRSESGSAIMTKGGYNLGGFSRL